VAFGDLDGANGPDLAVANSGGDNVSVLLSNCEPCPWDCNVPFDGVVDVREFLAMLSQWGNVGSSCDIDGGGVSVTDVLLILAHWGPCP
jgi:hypothetical protein